VANRKPTYHLVPSSYDTFHVKIAREEANDTIGYSFAVFNEDSTEIPDDSWLVSDFESGRNRNLI